MLCVVAYISVTIVHVVMCNIPSKSCHFSLSGHVKYRSSVSVYLPPSSHICITVVSLKRTSCLSVAVALLANNW